MSEQKKKPETTVATLDMAKSGQLTLTTKHLRGQVLKVIQQPGGAKIRQMEQIDVLLSALGGYSVVDIKLRMMRIVMRIIGTIVGILGALLWASDLGFLSEIGMFPTLIGFNKIESFPIFTFSLLINLKINLLYHIFVTNAIGLTKFEENLLYYPKEKRIFQALRRYF